MSLTDLEAFVPSADVLRSLRTGATLRPPLGLDWGHPVYTAAEIASWTDDSPGYAGLAGSWGGNNARSIPDLGSAITTNEQRDKLRDDAVYAKCQALLWAADGDSARLAKVAEVLDGVKDVTSWTGAAGQINLVAGWSMTNLCQAAAITGYGDPGFKAFLRNVAYPMLDWATGGNWFASFADSRLAIAAYLRDDELWRDAKAFLDFRCAQTIYHSAHDGGSVNPMRNQSWPETALSTVNSSRTTSHWWEAVTGAPWTAAYGGQPFADGTDAEVIRDISHEVMSTAGWVHAARTVLAQGDTLTPHVADRIAAHVEWCASRVLWFLQTGTLQSPAGVQGSPVGVGGSAYLMGWRGAGRLYADNPPESLAALLARPEVQNSSVAGANHIAAEHMADRG